MLIDNLIWIYIYLYVFIYSQWNKEVRNGSYSAITGLKNLKLHKRISFLVGSIEKNLLKKKILRKIKKILLENSLAFTHLILFLYCLTERQVMFPLNEKYFNLLTITHYANCFNLFFFFFFKYKTIIFWGDKGKRKVCFNFFLIVKQTNVGIWNDWTRGIIIKERCRPRQQRDNISSNNGDNNQQLLFCCCLAVQSDFGN